jgi:hypothetical protein
MPDFFFKNPTKSLPTVASIEMEWANVPDADVRKQIAYEYQYLRFHVWMLIEMRTTRAGSVSAPPYEHQLAFSLRAGAIKAAILISASISEAALRSHAERRGYALSPDLHRRTFGNVLKAWKISNRPRPDITPIWNELETLRLSRNRIHLHTAIGDPAALFSAVNANEAGIFQELKKILNQLKLLRSP